MTMLNDLVDESDPDLDLPNIVHAFQTAERIREEHPDKEWFQLVGLIHDLGKIMAFYGEPQWRWLGTLSQLAASPSRQLCLGRRASRTTRIHMIRGTTASWASTKKAVALRM